MAVDACSRVANPLPGSDKQMDADCSTRAVLPGGGQRDGNCERGQNECDYEKARRLFRCRQTCGKDGVFLYPFLCDGIALSKSMIQEPTSKVEANLNTGQGRPLHFSRGQARLALARIHLLSPENGGTLPLSACCYSATPVQPPPINEVLQSASTPCSARAIPRRCCQCSSALSDLFAQRFGMEATARPPCACALPLCNLGACYLPGISSLETGGHGARSPGLPLRPDSMFFPRPKPWELPIDPGRHQDNLASTTARTTGTAETTTATTSTKYREHSQ